jgi:glycosylphosphatidylinositol transamidase
VSPSIPYPNCIADFLSSVGLGYLKILVPPEKVLRWIEGKLNLLGRLPHYISVDQKTYGRYGVLPSSNATGTTERPTPMSYLGGTQRLGS